MIKKSASDDELLQLQTSLTKLYVQFDLFPNTDQTQITGLPPASYPRFSDFTSFLDNEINDLFRKGESMNQLEIEENEKIVSDMTSIKRVFDNLIMTYGNILGYSSIASIEHEQIVTFDIENLKKMKAEIFDAVMFLFFSLCWDNCISNGTIMKEKYEEKTS